MLRISFSNTTNNSLYPFKKIATKLVRNALEILARKNDDFTLAIKLVPEDEALKLNQKYRGKSYIPDVLSFPTNFSKNEIEIIGSHELGDIVISLEEAQRKADKYHHSLETEFAFLVVHGFLHLYGFDHEKGDAEEIEMFNWQDQILASENYKYDIYDIKDL